MTDAPSARPKNTRTYGKTRTDDAVPLEDRLAVLEDTVPRNLSPSRPQENITSRPPSPGSDVGGYTYGWKARLAAIDAGKEDDNLPSLDRGPQPFPLSSPTTASPTRTPHSKRVQSLSISASSSPILPLPYPLDVSPSLLGSTLPRRRSHDEHDGPAIPPPPLHFVSPSTHNISTSIHASPKDIDGPSSSDPDQSHDEARKKNNKGKKPKVQCRENIASEPRFSCLSTEAYKEGTH